jgi:hypothetical protein
MHCLSATVPTKVRTELNRDVFKKSGTVKDCRWRHRRRTTHLVPARGTFSPHVVLFRPFRTFDFNVLPLTIVLSHQHPSSITGIKQSKTVVRVYHFLSSLYITSKKRTEVTCLPYRRSLLSVSSYTLLKIKLGFPTRNEQFFFHLPLLRN